MLGQRENLRTAVAETAGSMPVDQRLLAALCEEGSKTMEQLAASLPNVSWTQVFLAVDRLSRAGRLLLRRTSRGDYQVSIGWPDA